MLGNKAAAKAIQPAGERHPGESTLLALRWSGTTWSDPGRLGATTAASGAPLALRPPNGQGRHPRWLSFNSPTGSAVSSSESDHLEDRGAAGPVLRDPARRCASTSRRATGPGPHGQARAAPRRTAPPPPGPDDLVDGELPPDVAQSDDGVQARVRHEDHVGVRAGRDGRQSPAGPGRQQVGHVLARAARSGRPLCSSRRIPRRQRCGVQLPPSGKMTSAPFGVEPRASRSISRVKMFSPV